MGFHDEIAKGGAECLLAHESLHLGNGNQGFLVDVMVSGGVSGIYDRFFVCILAVRPTLNEFESAPFFAVIDSRVLSISRDFVRPLGQVIEFCKNILDLLIGEQRRERKLVFGEL